MSGNDQEEELCTAFMQKKSRKKGVMKIENTKGRMFVLTKTHLKYYTGSPSEGRGKEKGSIKLSSVRIVEPVNEDTNFLSFQVLEELPNFEFCPLYISAPESSIRNRWVQAIKKACMDLDVQFFENYHSKSIEKSVFPCCGSKDYMEGCTKCKKLPVGDNSRHKTAPRVAPRVGQNVLHVPAPVKPPPSPTNSGQSYRPITEQTTPRSSPQPQGRLVLPVLPSTPNGTTKSVPPSAALLQAQAKNKKWYYPNLKLDSAKRLLNEHLQEGCYVIRPTSNYPNIFSISLVTKECGSSGSQRMPRCKVVHYHISMNRNKFSIDGKERFDTMDDFIYKYSQSRGCLPCRLKFTPNDVKEAASASLGNQIEVPLKDLMLKDILGKGEFGLVYRAIYVPKNVCLAAKMMKKSTSSKQDFIEEAKMMSSLNHPNICGLMAFAEDSDNIYLLSEYMENGSLLQYLKHNEKEFLQLLHRKPGYMIKFLSDVACGMAYLDSKDIVHRDLAARNCLVGQNEVVKVADFGLARNIVEDSEVYDMSATSKIPARWAAPEVMETLKHSSKSDVWSYGVLMWEVYTLGKHPYPRIPNILKFIQAGGRLEQPQFCPNKIYKLMQHTWDENPKGRPNFSEIQEILGRLDEQLDLPCYEDNDKDDYEDTP